ILLLLTYAAEDALDFRHGERHEHRLVGREQKLGLQQLEEQVLDELSLSPELCDQVGEGAGRRVSSHVFTVGHCPRGLSPATANTKGLPADRRRRTMRGDSLKRGEKPVAEQDRLGTEPGGAR